MKYSEAHVWVDIKGNIATIGITTYAQEQLGEIVFVELPKIGRSVAIADEVAVLESTKAAVDYYSPLSGKIVDINIELKEHPEWVNSSPEKNGWIFKLELKDSMEAEDLMDFIDYQGYIKRS